MQEKEETVEKAEEYSASMQQAMGTCKLRFLSNPFSDLRLSTSNAQSSTISCY